jgi:diguanylate cyclase (GGDEF)-like protein
MDEMPASVFTTLAHFAPELTLVVDAASRCRFASHSLEAVTGFTDDQLIGIDLLGLIEPIDRRRLLEMLNSTGEDRWERAPLGLTLKVCFADLTWHDVSVRIRRLPVDGQNWFLLNIRDETVQRQVEAALLRKTELEVLLERIQHRFNNSRPHLVDQTIESALEETSRFLGADRGYVLSYDLAAHCESMTHEWCSDEVEPEITDYQQIGFDTVPICMVRSLRGELVAIADLAELGAEWAADRSYLEAEGIRSLLELPVILDGRTMGSVGFDWISRSASWSTEDLTILGVLGSMFSQILARKESDQALERGLIDSQTRFAALVDNLPDPVMRVDVEGELLYANAAARRNLLVSRNGQVREIADVLASIAPLFAVALASNETQTVSSEVHTSQGWMHLETRVVPEPGPGGHPHSLLLVSSDLTERRQAEERLAHGANHDPLTGLANRNLFLSQLEQAADRFADGQVFAVLYFDLDRFKNVNDSFGHAAGDGLLREVSGRLASVLRHGDVLARLGGDEFTALLTDSNSIEQAVACAQRMLDAVAVPIAVAGHQMVITGSVGVAFATETDHEPLELLHRADAAMYQAKATGRARVVTFDPATSPLRRPLRIAAV